ncbi:MAG: response regulator [Elusimicrobiota bacterium]|jgi:excisionase family DNA binding protein
MSPIGDEPQKVFTTFEVGKICGVFHTTVINWVNKGKLKAHCTPGKHRRILLADLLEFMRRFEMPIPEDLLLRSKSALVVEDDPAVQRMIVRALQSLPGLKVQACANGLDAMIAVGKDAPELLVLDINIPKVNGLEVCEILRNNEQTKPIKIIAVSGQRMSAQNDRFLRENADAFYLKPLSTAELKAKALELLEMDPVRD